MPKIAPELLTEQQRKWFASLRDGLQRETGKPLQEWVAIAKTCPETAPKARLRWFKTTHGLLQNRASFVLQEAFPVTGGWDQPAALKAALWTDAESSSIFAAVAKLVMVLPEVIEGQRKGYSAWSHKYQFAAMRPLRGGKARLGLAVKPDADPLLIPAKNEGWSERLECSMILDTPRNADKRVFKLLQSAWAAS